MRYLNWTSSHYSGYGGSAGGSGGVAQTSSCGEPIIGAIGTPSDILYDICRSQGKGTAISQACDQSGMICAADKSAERKAADTVSGGGIFTGRTYGAAWSQFRDNCQAERVAAINRGEVPPQLEFLPDGTMLCAAPTGEGFTFNKQIDPKTGQVLIRHVDAEEERQRSEQSAELNKTVLIAGAAGLAALMLLK